MSEKKQIPKGWKSVTLGEILSVSSGKGLKINELQGGTYAVYGGNGINSYYSEYLIEEPKLIIGRVGVKCGVTYITRPKSWVTDNALIVTPKVDDFDIHFFKLKLEFENLNKLSVSTAQPVISGSKIYAYEIKYPPLNQQRQIVSKLEELFSKLDNGVESLKTLQQQLKVYRQAVLKWAFEGRLTNSNVKSGELPEGWKMVAMGNVIEDPQYGTSKKCSYADLDGKGVLRIPNIANGYVDSADLKYAIFDGKEIETYRLKVGDILVIRSNGSVDLVGKSAIITKRDEDYLYAGYLIKLRPLPHLILPKYLQNVLTSIDVRNQIESKAKSTSGVNNINAKELKSLIIPICSTIEQEKVVQEIESRLSICDKIEETITNGLKEAEALRQSILKHAFEGKLV